MAAKSRGRRESPASAGGTGLPEQALVNVPVEALPEPLCRWVDTQQPLPPGVTWLAGNPGFGAAWLAGLLTLPFLVWSGDWLWRLLAHRPWRVDETLGGGGLTLGLLLLGLWLLRRQRRRNAILAEGQRRLGLVFDAGGLLWLPDGVRASWWPRSEVRAIDREVRHYKSGRVYALKFRGPSGLLLEVDWGALAWPLYHDRDLDRLTLEVCAALERWCREGRLELPAGTQGTLTGQPDQRRKRQRRSGG